MGYDTQATQAHLVNLLKRTSDKAEAALDAGDEVEAKRLLTDSDAIARTLIVLDHDSVGVGMSKHTPKPWEYVGGAIVGPKLDDKETWLRPVVARFATGVSLANLNLMLAAPELLEALTDCVEQPQGEAALKKAKAAIAKATGEKK